MKKKTASSFKKKKLIIGTEKLPIKEDKEEYLNIKKITNQIIPNDIPRYKLIQQSIPTYVATPFPPLNFNHIGKTCPKKTAIEDVSKYSEKLNFIIKSKITALLISRTKVLYPINLLPVLSAFVAPMLPDPILRISFFKKIFVSKNPNGIDPIK